jgi:hypothetical protein
MHRVCTRKPGSSPSDVTAAAAAAAAALRSRFSPVNVDADLIKRVPPPLQPNVLSDGNFVGDAVTLLSTAVDIMRLNTFEGHTSATKQTEECVESSCANTVHVLRSLL